jgi:hypothetical protein
MRKLEVISNYTETKNFDLFLCQEMNIATRNTDFGIFIAPRQTFYIDLTTTNKLHQMKSTDAIKKIKVWT